MTRRLGKGLADLIETPTRNAASFVLLRTEQIRPGRLQPRTSISQQELDELAQSVKRQGVIQPIIVRPLAHGTYELVAGERRWRAAQLAGITEIPAAIKSLNDHETLEYSLVENLQRTNLNPIEEASAYERMTEEFGYTQEAIAETVGKDRATVANALRLLKLPEEIQQALRDGTITMGHAKVLLAAEGHAKQLALGQQILRDKLSVRQLELLVGTWQPGKRRRTGKGDPHIEALQEELRRTIGTKVTLITRKKGGRIIIEYFSEEDLTRLSQLLGVPAS